MWYKGLYALINASRSCLYVLINASGSCCLGPQYTITPKKVKGITDTPRGGTRHIDNETPETHTSYESWEFFASYS